MMEVSKEPKNNMSLKHKIIATSCITISAGLWIQGQNNPLVFAGINLFCIVAGYKFLPSSEEDTKTNDEENTADHDENIVNHDENTDDQVENNVIGVVDDQYTHNTEIATAIEDNQMIDTIEDDIEDNQTVDTIDDDKQIDIVEYDQETLPHDQGITVESVEEPVVPLDDIEDNTEQTPEVDDTHISDNEHQIPSISLPQSDTSRILHTIKRKPIPNRRRASNNPARNRPGTYKITEEVTPARTPPKRTIPPGAVAMPGMGMLNAELGNVLKNRNVSNENEIVSEPQPKRRPAGGVAMPGMGMGMMAELKGKLKKRE
eukprot:TRINITY_DN11124_c0_g1_i1.p1 TRINITY_DN11124_c0_g1~~TRINITY_DN11124_c0_g1_i1.p1  ORF type:complete len:317 (-),score=110.43 TRINITY_DN11124_c0_g1_i1:95-1045(-)